MDRRRLVHPKVPRREPKPPPPPPSPLQAWLTDAANRALASRAFIPGVLLTLTFLLTLPFLLVEGTSGRAEALQAAAVPAFAGSGGAGEPESPPEPRAETGGDRSAPGRTACEPERLIASLLRYEYDSRESIAAGRFLRDFDEKAPLLSHVDRRRTRVLRRGPGWVQLEAEYHDPQVPENEGRAVLRLIEDAGTWKLEHVKIKPAASD